MDPQANPRLMEAILCALVAEAGGTITLNVPNISACRLQHHPGVRLHEPHGLTGQVVLHEHDVVDQAVHVANRLGNGHAHRDAVRDRVGPLRLTDGAASTAPRTAPSLKCPHRCWIAPSVECPISPTSPSRGCWSRQR